MTEYAVIHKQRGEVLFFAGGDKVEIGTRRLVSPVVSGWEDDTYRVLVVEETNPSHDPLTQTKTGPVVTIEADKVTRVWTVTDKTQAEMDADADARKEAVLSDFDLLGLKVAFDQENRIRALEGKPQITAKQFRDALKARL